MKKTSTARSVDTADNNYSNVRRSELRDFFASRKQSFDLASTCVNMDCDEPELLSRSMILETTQGPGLVKVDGRNQVEDGGFAAIPPHASICPDADDRKRPLSISSTSSAASSSSSLPRHVRKRIANMSSSAALNSSLGDTGGENASCEMLSTVAECSPGDAYGSASAGGFFDKDVCNGDVKKTGQRCCSTDALSPTSPAQYHLRVMDGYLATSDVEESASSSARNSLDCLTPPFENSESKLLTGTVYVERVVQEILDTERNYVRDLSDIVQGYINQIWKNAELGLSKDDVDALFGNIETVWKFNRYFLSKLEECDRDPIKIAKCFVNETDGFGIYSTFCTNYPRSMETLMQCMKDEKIAGFLKKQQMVLQHGLPLGSYLLKPVQRILKYHILLQNIFNNYDASDEGHAVIQNALDSMMNVALHINELKRRHEYAVRVQEVQCRLCDWDGADLTSHGNLVLEERFRVCGAKALRRLFLFEKALLLTKEKDDGMLLVKGFIPCSNLMFIESVPKEPLSFQVVPFNAPREQVTLQASSLEQKRLWCHWIKKLILETFGAKIPDKAKELVMTLGKSRDEEDYESSNLEIPELVKKQHSAPEYLERRKGRRKSAGFIQDLKLKPKKGLRSGMSSSDVNKLKKDETKFVDRSSTDMQPITDDEESVSVSCEDDGKLSNHSFNSHDADSGSQDTPIVEPTKLDFSFDSQSTSRASANQKSKTLERNTATPSNYYDRSASASDFALTHLISSDSNNSVTDVESPCSSRDSKSNKVEVCRIEKGWDNGKQRGTVIPSQSTASLGKVVDDVEQPCAGGFRRSNSASCGLRATSKDAMSSVDLTDDDDSCFVEVNRRITQESGGFSYSKKYFSLRRQTVASTSNMPATGSLCSSVSQPSLEEPRSTLDARNAYVTTSVSNCTCSKSPSHAYVSNVRMTSTPVLHDKCQSATQIISSNSLKKNGEWRQSSRSDKFLKSNLAKELLALEHFDDDIESDSDDGYLDSVRSALTRLSSRFPNETLQSTSSSSTIRTYTSSRSTLSDRSENSTLKSEERKDMRNKLARLLGRSPNSRRKYGKSSSSSDCSSPTSPSLADFLKERHSMIGQRMAVNPDQNFDSVFTIANRTHHHRPLLSDCQRTFQTQQAESGATFAPDVCKEGMVQDQIICSPQQHDEQSRIIEVRVESENRKDVQQSDQAVDEQFRTDCSGDGETEFYYENKLLQDLEDDLESGECDDGDCSDVRSDDDINDAKASCPSPSVKTTIPITPRMTIKETLYSIERRSNARPVRKVEVHLGEKAQGMQEILQTLENVNKNGHEKTNFYSKTVHRTVRDRSRELAVCAAITRVRQNNCNIVNGESLTDDEQLLINRTTKNQYSETNESPEPETQTSHL